MRTCLAQSERWVKAKPQMWHANGRFADAAAAAAEEADEEEEEEEEKAEAEAEAACAAGARRGASSSLLSR